jgi:hypothetical protein
MSKTIRPFTEVAFMVFCHYVLKAFEKYADDPTKIIMFNYPTPAAINNVEIGSTDEGINITFYSKSKRLTIILPSLRAINSSRTTDFHTLVAEALQILKNYFNNEREFTNCTAQVEANYSIWTIGEKDPVLLDKRLKIGDS